MEHAESDIRVRSKMRRLKPYFTMLTILIATVSFGSARDYSLREAQTIVKTIEEQIPNPASPQIFLNNLRVALLMLIPGLGVALSLTSMYSTGSVIAAFSVVQDIPWYFLVLGLMLTPFFWLEFAAYTLASTQSIFLFISPFRRTLRIEVRRAALIIPLIIMLLLIGAIVEALIIGTLRA